MSRAHVEVSGGRRIDYLELGDPQGAPAIYLHGTPSSASEARCPGGLRPTFPTPEIHEFPGEGHFVFHTHGDEAVASIRDRARPYRGPARIAVVPPRWRRTPTRGGEAGFR